MSLQRKEFYMNELPMLSKFPEGSANRDYDIFEELPNGTTVWRACILGMANVEVRLQALAKESTSRFFALSLQDRSEAVIRPVKSLRRQDIHRAG
jgi:hypothetical protein